MKTLIFLAGFLLLSQISVSQNYSDNLKGKNGIAVNYTLLNPSSANSDGLLTFMHKNLFGSISVHHWFTSRVALELNPGIIHNSKRGGMWFGFNESTISKVVLPLFIGARYNLKADGNLQPFASMTGGPVLQIKKNKYYENGRFISERTENKFVFGIKPTIGLDYYFNKWLKSGINIGYYIMGDFSDYESSTEEYSGADISLSAGVIF
jgi:outer membrane protein W